MPVRPRRRLLPFRRRTVSTAVTAVLVSGTFAGLLSVTGAPSTPEAHAAAEAKAPKPPSPTASSPEPSSPAPVRAPAAVPQAKAPASVVQVVAHPDDDLFFMNPDISQTLHSGTP